MLIFDAAQFHGILRKISEFNDKLVSNKVRREAIYSKAVHLMSKDFSFVENTSY